tara:strand:- start:1010 stop:1669 length:660 start_codon:yes stop_codon:yes gene_type:complete
MTDQLILNFPSKNLYLKEDYYVSSSNKDAYNFINSWPKWPKRIVNVFGPDGSGKTHTVSLLKNKTSLIKISKKEINDEIFYKLKTKEALIIEDFDEKISESIFFSLWNKILQDNKYLLITSIEPVINYKFKLEDLNSRINSCIRVGIKLPSDNLIAVILSKNFSDKQINVKKNHIDYILKRIDRSYEKISKFISILDKYSLKKGSPVSLKLIKEVLKMI